MDPELLKAAEAFHADDPDEATRAELAGLLASVRSGAGSESLRERFGSRLEFGTAGLRGLIGAGTSRMNRRMVALATAALCAHLERILPDAKARGLCIGFDGRHQSTAFAREVAEVASGAGFVVHAFTAVVPTPLLAFSVRERGAAAGVMVTASHNPAEYNGYKVYLWDGAQLGRPHDAAISDGIDALPSALALPRRTQEDALAAGAWRSLDGVDARYLDAVMASLGDATAPLGLRVVYTAMHGVGERLALALLARAGVTDLHSVPEQAAPDPEFPTVAFPNPEEPGALDLALALARDTRAQLVIANDPDADRLALAGPDARGVYAALSGNQIGLLLADHLLRAAPRDGRNSIVTTIVSTPLVERVAAAHGARCVRTLTGFKWIIERAIQLEAQGLRLVLGFEEALGYCVGTVVRDKDGIAAGAHAARMAASHAQHGRTLHDALTLLYRQHGLCESQQRSIVRPGLAGLQEIRASMQRLRDAPPERLAGLRVVQLTDLARGVRVREGVESDPELPRSDVLAFELEGDQRVTIRPSGTEPKIKLYADAWTQLDAAEDVETGRLRALALGRRLIDAVCERAGLA